MPKAAPRNAYRNPVPTVDIIIEIESPAGNRGVVLIERKNPPPGWALPGGFVDYGESLEAAAVREAREETGLDVELRGQLHTYSDPDRDPRLHTVSTVFIAAARGVPKGGDDARRARVVDPAEATLPLAFDHRRILEDYVEFKRGRNPWTSKTKKMPRARRRGTSRNSAASTDRSRPT